MGPKSNLFGNWADTNIQLLWGATIAQWICSHLPSCHPGSNPKHTINTFFNLNLNLNCDVLKGRK